MQLVVALCGKGLPVPVNEISRYFASLVSSDRGVAPLRVPEGPDKDGPFQEFSPVTVKSVEFMLARPDISKCSG